MRHNQAGLAIPDFPLAFGSILPPVWNPGIAIHFAHRLGAVAVLIAASLTVARVWTVHRSVPALRRPALCLVSAGAPPGDARRIRRVVGAPAGDQYRACRQWRPGARYVADPDAAQLAGRCLRMCRHACSRRDRRHGPTIAQRRTGRVREGCRSEGGGGARGNTCTEPDVRLRHAGQTAPQHARRRQHARRLRDGRRRER